MNTLEDLRRMTVRDVGNWSYRTLDIPAETKALIERAEGERRNERVMLPGNPDVYTRYMERTEGKEKGEDLLNDVCAVFDNVKQIILSEEDIGALAPGKKQEIEARFEAMYTIRNRRGSGFDTVRTVMGSQLPEVLPGSLRTDYNVMIYTVAKTRVDACLKQGLNNRLLREVLSTHFLEEKNIVSNCVDIPIIPYIAAGQKENYFAYLRAAVDAVRGLTEAVLSYIQLKEDRERHYGKYAPL